MSNGNDRSIWGHVRDGAFFLGIITGGGIAYTNGDRISEFSAQIARISAIQEAHIANHPNVELQRQINDLAAEMRQMRRDIRELERDHSVP